MSHERSFIELKKKLDSQLRFLKTSSELYDKGFEDEAQRLSVSLRVLFYDSKNSTSLVTSLGVINDTFIVSSAEQYFPTNMNAYTGLLILKSIIGSGGYYVPQCSTTDELPNKWLKISDWWNEIILDDKTNVFSRKDLILTTANQDGGAHVDTKIDGSFANLTINNSLGWMHTDDDMKLQPFQNNPAYACIRQIAEEVLVSFRLQQQTKNYTRHRINGEATVAHVNHSIYIYVLQQPLDISQPLFKDNRVEQTEKRRMYDDHLLFLNGTSMVIRVFL